MPTTIPLTSLTQNYHYSPIDTRPSSPFAATSPGANIPPAPPTKTPTTTPNPPLLTLPAEIHLLILPHLPYPSVLLLRLTNHHFYTLLTTPVLTRLKTLYISTLLSLPPPWGGSPTKLDACPSAPCFTCLHILPSTSFDDPNWTLPPAERRRRKCIPCKIRAAEYAPGETFRWGHTQMVVCKRCGDIEALGPESVRARSEGHCEGCYRRRWGRRGVRGVGRGLGKVGKAGGGGAGAGVGQLWASASPRKSGK
ncbi:hypothetical protein MMC24_006521 [Lignoscripta atroalba]|nr:hypothetical protein [Lignoscripta atroalba]